MDPYRIDHHKLIYHPERTANWLNAQSDWEKAKEIFPIYMEISPVGYCNHRCTFCALDFREYRQDRLPLSQLNALITQCAEVGVKSLMFAGEGEPCLHPDLPKVIELCHQLKIDSALTTNFVPVTAEKMATYLRYCKWIKVSVAGGDAATYAKIHRTHESDFHKLIANLKLAVAMKRQEQWNCTLGAQILLLPDNVHTILELAKILEEIGLDYLVIKPYSHHPQSLTTLYQNIDYRTADFLTLDQEVQKWQASSARLKLIYRKATIEKLYHPERGHRICHAVPYLWAYVTAQGDLLGCSCRMDDEKMNLGNLAQHDFKTLWQSPKRRACIEYTHHTLDIGECRVNCRMDAINRYLHELVTPNDHVNFI